MNYYTSQIPPTLAKKLKEKGMPMDCGCNLCCLVPGNGTEEYTYGFVFDWLIEKRVSIDFSTRAFFIIWDTDGEVFSVHKAGTWHEAANAAIEKALELIKRELTMKSFNYNAAKSGAPVQTRDGRKARIICWDYKGIDPDLEIIAIITEEEGFEETSYHYADGRSMKGYPCPDDLVMVSEDD